MEELQKMPAESPQREKQWAPTCEEKCGIKHFVIPKKGQPIPKEIPVSHAHYHHYLHATKKTAMSFKAADVSGMCKIILRSFGAAIGAFTTS